MKIELHIGGEFVERWFYDDIRAKDYSEAAIQDCRDRVAALIGDLKIEIYQHIQGKDYRFYIVYQSNFNFWNYSEKDIFKFNKEINKAS